MLCDVCKACGNWVHKRCSGVAGKLKDGKFRCSSCVSGDTVGLENKHELKLNACDALEIVSRLCYVGDMIGAGGDAGDATRARV